MSRMQLSLRGDDAEEFFRIQQQISREVGVDLNNAQTLRYLMNNSEV